MPWSSETVHHGSKQPFRVREFVSKKAAYSSTLRDDCTRLAEPPVTMSPPQAQDFQTPSNVDAEDNETMRGDINTSLIPPRLSKSEDSLNEWNATGKIIFGLKAATKAEMIHAKAVLPTRFRQLQAEFVIQIGIATKYKLESERYRRYWKKSVKFRTRKIRRQAEMLGNRDDIINRLDADHKRVCQAAIDGVKIVDAKLAIVSAERDQLRRELAES